MRLLAVLLAVAAARAEAPGARRIAIYAGASAAIDSADDVARVAISDPAVAEVVVATAREVLINGKRAGSATAFVWTAAGARSQYEISVQDRGEDRLAMARRELVRELQGQAVEFESDGTVVYVRGIARDLLSAQRAVLIASAVGKPVNLLRVQTPDAPAQILLKVRFADVDRSAALEIGANLMSTGKTAGSATTGQFAPPQLSDDASRGTRFVLSDLLNVFLFRPDLDIAATLRLLNERKLVETLAEPNLLALDGQKASFLAGGEFPFPVAQGGGINGPTISISFKEFGIRLNFVPNVTARGTIRLSVAPEVSSLDYANGIVYQGFNIPGIATRRVETEVELAPGQSFGIAGLLDQRLRETVSKVPGLGDVPLLGKLFQSKSVARNNSELLVVVTPEIVRPAGAGEAPATPAFPKNFLDSDATAPRFSAPAGSPLKQTAIPVEVFKQGQRQTPAQN